MVAQVAQRSPPWRVCAGISLHHCPFWKCQHNGNAELGNIVRALSQPKNTLWLMPVLGAPLYGDCSRRERQWVLAVAVADPPGQLQDGFKLPGLVQEASPP